MLDYVCNVCGAAQAADLSQLDREAGACGGCGAWVRPRATTHLVSLGLFGRSLPVPEWPASPQLRGLGISDWRGFAAHYAARVHYENTHLHKRPRLDLRDPPDDFRGRADFVSCSDVLEHVEGEVQPAFDGLFSLLKPGGTLVLTVPYGFGETVEHFPRLHDWRLEPSPEGATLVNVTLDGEVERFSKLCFHGGPGQVLEMRIFGLPDLQARLAAAGFEAVEVLTDDVLEYGVRLVHPWSRPISARRPA